MDFGMISYRRARMGAASLGLALLASCGGSEQVQQFEPTRLIAFGDEHSLLDDSASPANARKFSINATVSSTDATLLCSGNQNWVQVLAGFYGRVFAQCNAAAAPVTALMHAEAGAKVANIAAQIARVTDYSDKDLVTVLAGARDIIEQYERFPGVPEATLADELEASGEALANQVNVLADAGAKVLISTVPDLGLTPYALAQKAANTDTDRAALLTRLTQRFNARLRAQIYNDGRRIGLLLTDELVQTLVKFPLSYGFVNISDEACLSSAPAPTCTSLTLQPVNGAIPAANAANWIWAHDRYLSPGVHARLGSLAATRASGNPF